MRPLLRSKAWSGRGCKLDHAPGWLLTAQWTVAGVGAACLLAWWLAARRGADPLGRPIDAPFPPLGAPTAAGLAAYFVFAPLAFAAVVPALGGRDALSRPGELLVSAGLSLLVGLGLLPFARRAGPPRVSTGRCVTAGVVGGLGTFAVTSVIGLAILYAYARAGLPVPEQDSVGLVRDATGVEFLGLGIGVLVVAPFVEEVLYRGLILPTLANAMPLRAALIVQALLFGGAHVLGAPERWPLAIPLAAVGWFAGYLYVRTRSIAAPAGLHGTFNAIIVAMVLAQIPGAPSET